MRERKRAMSTCHLQDQVEEAFRGTSRDLHSNHEFWSFYQQLADTPAADKEAIAGEVLSDLVARLQDPDPESRRRAVCILEALGAAARSALPAILKALTDPDMTTHCLAID